MSALFSTQRGQIDVWQAPDGLLFANSVSPTPLAQAHLNAASHCTHVLVLLSNNVIAYRRMHTIVFHQPRELCMIKTD
jgi:hypothetical protein